MSEIPNSAWNTAVRTGYDRWALVYDHDGNPLVALEAPFVRAAVGDVRGQAVLDLGCGTGRHTFWLAQSGAAVTAGLRLEHVGEHAPDAAVAERCPRAAKYVGWPMLVLLRLLA